jgi:phosphoglycolate phosphatase
VRPMDAILFDLDGTLADTLEDIASAMDEVLRSLGQPGHPPEAYRRFIGEGAAVLVARALPADRGDLAGRALEAFRQRYRAHLVERTRPYDGIAEVLEALQGRGTRLAVLSNKPHDLTVEMVERLFRGIAFGAVAGQRPGSPPKPDPAAALEIARTLGVPPAHCALVGDGPTDMDAARAAGMMPIAVSWGFRDRRELEAHGAAKVIDHPSDLLKLG